MVPVDPAELSNDDWNRIQRAVAAFEAAWGRGGGPALDDHLFPADDPCREALLIELVHVDLEIRLKAGEPARVEGYLRRFPGLASDGSRVVELIRAEWKFRRRLEPGLALAEYAGRFPDFRDELAAGSDEGSTLAASGLPGDSGPSAKAGPVEESAFPRRLGKYELRQRVGAGSFGVVYRAWDTLLKREVAVKIPRAEALGSPADVQDFTREARAALGLRHPNIVEIHDASTIDGTPCVVRAFIDGGTLAERAQVDPFKPKEAARLMVAVAKALEHAHSRGIIHRDLKPTNILLDGSGKPFVTDFGLAKRSEGDSAIAAAGSGKVLIGTLAYMAPEQARGDVSAVDARSDVYGAGVVLYELLAGAPPFRGRGRLLQVQVEGSEPAPPSAFNEDVPAPLESICLRALAKRPEDRYPTAAALAEDLENFLDGRPIDPPPAVASARRWKRPGRVQVATSAAFLALGLALIAAVGLWARAESRRSADAAAARAGLRAILEVARMPSRPGDDPAEAGHRLAEELWERAEEVLGTMGLDPALRPEVADAAQVLAEHASRTGSLRRAVPAWRRAVRLFGPLAVDGPRRVDLARGLARLARLEADAGRSVEGGRLAARAAAVWADLAASARLRSEADPLDRVARIDLARAIVEGSARDLGPAGDVIEGESIAEDLARVAGLAISERREVARILLDAAAWELAAGHSHQSQASSRLAVRLCLEGPDRAGLAIEAARGSALAASALVATGQDEAALEESRVAIARFEAIADDDPTAVDAWRGLAAAEALVGRLLDRRGRFADAILAHRRAIRAGRAALRLFPEADADLAARAAARGALGAVLARQGRPVAALGPDLLAVADAARAALLAPGVARRRRELAELLEALAHHAAGARERLARSARKGVMGHH